MKRLIILGLSIFALTQMHGMEQQPTLRFILNKEQQKGFRDVLSQYRSIYVYEKFLNATGQIENKAEMRLHRDIENELNEYKKHYYEHDKFVRNAFDKLEKFKTKEVIPFFQNRQVSRK